MAARKSTGGTAAKVRTSDVIAFRLHAHHLTNRRPADEAAGACGIQNSPPGSALLALHARVEDVTTDGIDHLVGEEKSLLQTWCMRGAPFYFPTVDAPAFTTGVLPTTETARLHLILGVEQALNTLGMGLDEAVDLTKADGGHECAAMSSTGCRASAPSWRVVGHFAVSRRRNHRVRISSTALAPGS